MQQISTFNDPELLGHREDFLGQSICEVDKLPSPSIRNIALQPWTVMEKTEQSLSIKINGMRLSGSAQAHRTKQPFVTPMSGASSDQSRAALSH
ncbi:hypothetical protein [Burkholderia latens]|uniref:Uncharacterized protein n=1 Tax=Burkholderia latens TaxID=488446 RepID=A0A6H9TDX7_9BURK|nr:hypothetical protein [Burkholderia latens]KAB0641976.1 hypothetical protein F7R21_13765 [Burkholderia latens]